VGGLKVATLLEIAESCPRVLLLDYWISYVVLAKAAPA